MCEHQHDSQLEVAAIVTAMTDAEQAFVRDTIESVLADLGIGQIVLCIEEQNAWNEGWGEQSEHHLNLEIKN